MTDAETIHAAAQMIRERAVAATRGPWVAFPTDLDNDYAWTVSRPYDDHDPDVCTDDCGKELLRTGAEGCEEDGISETDAHYIATMHPGVADAVADWLDRIALLLQCPPVDWMDRKGRTRPIDHRILMPALDLARVVLGQETRS